MMARDDSWPAEFCEPVESGADRVESLAEGLAIAAAFHADQGTDRRVADLSKSASGNRARELAQVLSVLAETLRMRRDQSADFASSEYGAGFADGMSQAYEAAADMLRHHARAEDVR